MKRRLVQVSGWLSLGLWLATSTAHAQFNPQGRGRAKPGAPAKNQPTRPQSRSPRAPSTSAPPSTPAATTPSPAAENPREPAEKEPRGPGAAALIARYTNIALSQPGAEFPMQRLAELYRSRDGNLDALIQDLKQRAEQAGPTRPSVLLCLAAAYQQDGRHAEAIGTYERVLADSSAAAPPSSTAPNSTTPSGSGSASARLAAELGLARLHADRGEKAVSREHYKRALAELKEPAERERVQRLVIGLSLDLGDVASARAQHAELVRQQPGSFFVRAELGRELLSRGMYADAVIELERVVKAGAGDNRVLAPALRDYGRALAKAGRRADALKELQRALAAAGSQSGVRREIYESIVEVYRAENRLPEFTAELERRGARDAEEQRLLGALFEETGALDKALAAYRRALAGDPKDIATRLKVVHILEVQGELQAAIAEYEALTRAAPRNPDYAFRLAEALLQHGDRKRALVELRALEGRSQEDDDVLSALVDFYERVGEKNASMELLKRLSSRGATDPLHLVELGSRYYQEGDKPKALATWQRIRTVARDKAQGLLTLADIYLEHDMVEESLAALDEAVKLDPRSVKLRRAQAMAFERAGTASSQRDARQKYHEQALKLWEQLLKEGSTQPDLSREARKHIVTLWSLSGTLAPRANALARRLSATPPDLPAGRLLAEVEIRLRRYSEAEKTLRKIVDIEKGDVESLVLLERVLGLSRKLPEAIQVLERLARAEPKRAREHYQKMAEYAAELYRDEDAIRYAARAVELSPDDAEGHKKLGQMYRKRGDLARAVNELRLAIQKNERLFPVYFDLAELLLSQGQEEEADLLLRRVVRAAPDEELVMRAARLSLQVNLGRSSVEVLERELLPLSLDNPERPVYRRLLVEVYGAVAYPLLHGAEDPDRKVAADAQTKLRQLGERAVKPLLDALGDARESQQETATTLLAYVANKSAAPALLAYAAGNAPARLRARAVLAVGALADESLVPKLSEIVAPEGKARAEQSDPVLLAAAWGLCRARSVRARPALLAMTESPAEGLRALGVLGLALQKDPQGANAIVRVLSSIEAGSLPRAAAAFAVGELRLEKQGSLLSELADSSDPLLAASALTALARVDAKRAEPRLAEKLLAPSDPESARLARSAALVFVAGARLTQAPVLPMPRGELDAGAIVKSVLPSDLPGALEPVALTRLAQALPVAAARLVRAGPESARAVAESLESDASKPPFAALLVETGNEPEVRKQATALAARIAEQHVAAFVGWTEHPAPEVRAFAVAFLAQQAADIAVKATVAAVKDADVNVRNVALASLTPRHAAAAPELIRLSESEDWSVRLAAVRAQGAILEATGPAAVIASLSQRATGDRTAIVREAALAALAKGAKPAARPILERARESDPEPHVRAAAGAWLSAFSAP